MIINETGFVGIDINIGSVVPEPIVMELTDVQTKVVSTITIDEFFINRNDGILGFTFFRTTQQGPYNYRILGNNAEYDSGLINFITKLQKASHERGIDRQKYGGYGL